MQLIHSEQPRVHYPALKDFLQSYLNTEGEDELFIPLPAVAAYFTEVFGGNVDEWEVILLNDADLRYRSREIPVAGVVDGIAVYSASDIRDYVALAKPTATAVRDEDSQ